jgi:hypothetical protein
MRILMKRVRKNIANRLRPFRTQLMLDLHELIRAGKSKKARSWITDPIRSLQCHFLWPYFRRLLVAIEEQGSLFESFDKEHRIRQDQLQQRQDQLQQRQDQLQQRQDQLQDYQEQLQRRQDQLQGHQEHLRQRQEHLQQRQNQRSGADRIMPSPAKLIFHSHSKCATVWVGAYLDALAKRNGLSYLHSHYSEAMSCPKADIFFYTDALYSFASKNGLGGYHIIRNPFSIILSAYYSYLKTHSLYGWPALERQRSVLQSVDRETGLFLTTAFLERADFYEGAVGPLYGIRTWDYFDENFITIRMEDLVRNPGLIFKEIVGHEKILPDDNEFRFENFSGGRRVGEVSEDSHFRSGDSDEWKTVLPKGIIRYISEHFEAMLERYYPDLLEWSRQETR